MAEYTMRIGLSALKHLGIGLYSNIPSVLSEAVANAWDADAKNVHITLDQENGTIVIQDDGHGMDRNDANHKYLYVGYDRRNKDGGTTKAGRRVMGRKGIGKLSLFSIANKVSVHSAKNGRGHGFSMDAGEIEREIAENGTSGVYNPKPLEPAKDLERGTRITLTCMKMQIRMTAALRKRIARRFSVIGNAFNVYINKEPITSKDRSYQDKLEYVWLLGDMGRREIPEAAGLERRDVGDPNVKIDGASESIDGWIGTVRNSGQLNDTESGQSDNRIAIMVRGKMAQEDILEEIGGAGMYSKYVVGEIHADFLDTDGKDDIATTSRQKIREGDPRYEAVKEKIRDILKTIGAHWTDFRNERGESVALEIPGIKKWYGSLDDDHRNAAKKLFGKINRLDLEDDSKRPLFAGGVLAFESLKLRNMLDKIEKIDAGNIKDLEDVFLQMDSMEAAAYYPILATRLEVIHALESKTERNERERVIQKCIFDNLWLIDPEWRRVPGTEMLEKSLSSGFKDIDDNLSEEEKKYRVDIGYRTVGDRLVIIELKRPDVVADFMDIAKQTTQYRDAAQKILRGLKESENVDIVCIVGKKLRGWKGNSKKEESDRNAFREYNGRILYYNELVHGAQKAYGEYLERRKRVSQLYDLIREIDESDRDELNPP